MSEWQPIDTAPKDGDRFVLLGPPIILGFAPDETNYSLPSCEGHWRPKLGDGGNGRRYSAGWVSTLDPHREPPGLHPTHWMPLPDPPPTDKGG